MQITGFEQLAQHVPALNSTGGKFRLASKFIGIFALTTLYFILTDNIPTWTLDSQIVVISLGYLILSRFFTQKNRYIEKYKELAYAKAFEHFVISGLAVVFASVVHIAYMNGPKFTQPLITTILTWIGWIFILIGIPLLIRTITVFGVDNVAMLYVYFPSGEIVRSSIYSIIRHPVYGAVLRICIGLACLNRGIYPLTFVLVLPLLIFGWLRLVEEKELIERIPEYVEYRRKVPAFFPYPNRAIDFFKFLFTGK
jgi:protein-S-isoprenylcysteine O-methyltransferase Ste14